MSRPVKTLEIKRLQSGALYPDLDIVSEELDRRLPLNLINEINWMEFSYKPSVGFAMGYTSREILLKYYVTEEWFKAEMTEPNQNVYEDSCVEFFVSPADDGIYYNLEFNAIGTCLMGSGTSRENNRRSDPGIFSGIRRLASPATGPSGLKKGSRSWTLTLGIPFILFFHHAISDPEGTLFRANFYKCGDRLNEPHYLTWNPVRTEKPDFHRPEYFGAVRFV